MDKTVLGISALYHDAAAAIVRGGQIVAAAQEERFSRVKHDPRFPQNAINYCLEEASIEPQELDAVVFYDHPALTLDRILKNSAQAGIPGFRQFQKAASSFFGNKWRIHDLVAGSLRGFGRAGKLYFAEHHLSHAASAFYPSPFDNAAIITMDGVGEWATMTIGVGDGDRIELTHEIDYPHSLGLLYSAFTYYCGFKVNSGEYKLMGLAPYGRPRYYELIRKNLLDIKEDGSFRLNTEYFGFLSGLVMTNGRFDGLFGGPARKPESRITRREMDLAASIQQVTEEITIKIARHAKKITGARYAVFAGGVALNCVANGKIAKARVFERIWLQPAAGDAGGALGAALLGSHQLFHEARRCPPDGHDAQRGSFLGPSYSGDEIAAFLNRNDLPHVRIADARERSRRIAAAIADGKTVGYFSGRMEYGPRALGARSILGDPRRPDTQSIMNLKIKFRESFRPFAPSVLRERAADYFENGFESPYMLLIDYVKKERRHEGGTEELFKSDDDMLVIINRGRSDVPAITHVDYSARVQTVDREVKPDFYGVIEEFEKLTGCAMVVNTSFNVRGEPIVCTPEDAYRCFMRTGIDLLVLEDSLLWKDQQPQLKRGDDSMREYEPD